MTPEPSAGAESGTGSNRRRCPECLATLTSQYSVKWRTDSIEEVRTCELCDTQYTVNFESLVKEVEDARKVA